MTKISVTKRGIGEVAKKYTRLVVTEDAPSWHRLVECKDGTLEYRMGAGKRKAMDTRKFITFVRSIVMAAKGHQIEYLAIELSKSPFPKLEKLGEEWIVSTIAENLLLADYEFKAYKRKQKGQPELKEILICGGMNKKAATGFKRGTTLATYTNKARDIANTPGADMGPTELAKAAADCAKGTKIKVSVMSSAAVKKAGMGALYAVGKGAADGAKMIVMEYYGLGKPKKNEKGSKGENKKRNNDKHDPIILVGKGITYDTGGLNVKPSGAMHDMHLDMSGGSSVIGAISAAAKLGVKKNIVALIPTAENAVSAQAMRAGDIVKAYNGKTIEVLHTDAEGRLVLADGLSYAAEFNPRAVLDVATLTGAALVALGQHASAIMTKDEKLQAKLVELGEESGGLRLAAATLGHLLEAPHEDPG